ncbi:hypothetical protein SK128_003336 [Halocaridina rubra]|uniref:Uncharacterized protein n=1 Tax=Halocaridina rubra TaxID=373956 RepID=A0AAN9ACK5_HALRR
MEGLAYKTKKKIEQMAYPARLEVATLLAGSEGVADEGCLSAAAADASCSLPPVVDTSKTGGTPSPLYVIGDASKRSKSAGVGLSGRVLPLGLGSNIRPNGQTTTTHLSVSSSRPRSSPYIGRRHTRVTPLPCTVLQSTLSHDAEESCTASQTPSKSAKWGREKGKVSHSKNASLENGETVPWPSSSLDSEGMEQRTSTPIQGSSSIALESKSPWSSGSSPWTGGATYPVPTINIASEQSTPATHKKWRYHCHSSASERSEM